MGYARKFSVESDFFNNLLNRHGDIMILIDGNLIAVRRESTWRIFSSTNFMEHIISNLGQIKQRRSDKELLSMFSVYIGIICFSLRNRRRGGLIVISDKKRIKKLMPSDISKQKPVEILYQKLIAGKHVIEIPFELLCNAIAVDGATLIEIDGKFLKYGAVLNMPFKKSNSEGARTKAAEHASKYGLAIKISEDGPITIYSKSKITYQVD